MSNKEGKRCKVGELRPSQALTTFGIGSIIDLPNLSVMVMGLEDWPFKDTVEIGEQRLLASVKEVLGILHHQAKWVETIRTYRLEQGRTFRWVVAWSQSAFNDLAWSATVTVRNLKVLKIDSENHLILVKGAVPGANGGYVVIRKAVAAKPEPQPQLQEKPKKGKK